MLDFSPFRPETNGRNEGAFRTLFRRPFRFGFYPREGSAPPEDPLRCTRGPFADAALPPSHATPSGLRPISRSAPLYGQRSDGAVECREHRPDAGRAPDHRDAPREQVSARRPNGQSAGSQVAPTANHYETVSGQSRGYLTNIPPGPLSGGQSVIGLVSYLVYGQRRQIAP